MCKVSLLFSALYAKCPYYLVLYDSYMQSVLIIQSSICKVSLIFCASYATCPYYPVVLYASIQSIAGAAGGMTSPGLVARGVLDLGGEPGDDVVARGLVRHLPGRAPRGCQVRRLFSPG